MKLNKLLIGVIGALLAGESLAGEQTASSELIGEIAASCTISATNADFGTATQAQAGQTLTANPNLTINCSNGSGYSYFLDQSVNYELTKNTSLFTGAPVVTGAGTISGASDYDLLNGTDPIGKFTYWSSTAKTVKMPTASNVLTGTGSGAAQTIALAVDWTLPSSVAITGGSYGRFKLTNNYKVVF